MTRIPTEKERRELELQRIISEMLPINRRMIGEALLQHIKRGITVTRAQVMLTHQNIHDMWRGDGAWAKRIRARYPLSLTLPTLDKEKPEVIDCRAFTVPWNVALPVPSPTQSNLPPAEPSSDAAESESLPLAGGPH